MNNADAIRNEWITASDIHAALCHVSHIAFVNGDAPLQQAINAPARQWYVIADTLYRAYKAERDA